MGWIECVEIKLGGVQRSGLGEIRDGDVQMVVVSEKLGQ